MELNGKRGNIRKEIYAKEEWQSSDKELGASDYKQESNFSDLYSIKVGVNPLECKKNCYILGHTIIKFETEIQTHSSMSYDS